MKILVLNSGSSSQKACLYEVGATLPEHPPACLWEGKIEFGGDTAAITVKNPHALVEREQVRRLSRISSELSRRSPFSIPDFIADFRRRPQFIPGPMSGSKVAFIATDFMALVMSTVRNAPRSCWAAIQPHLNWLRATWEMGARSPQFTEASAWIPRWDLLRWTD